MRPGACFLALSLVLGYQGACQEDTSLQQIGSPYSRQPDQCRDFPRWDGERYTGAEHYTCLTYCEINWCTKDSFQKPVMENGIPTYAEGITSVYYVLERMKKSPFLWPVVDRLGVNDSDITSAHQAVLKGWHWYPWDCDYARTVLVANGYSKDNFPGFHLLSTFKSEVLKPPQERIDACQRAGKVLGLDSWLMNEGTIRCEDVPDAVKDANTSQLNSYGKTVRKLWDKACSQSRETKKYLYTCYASGPQVMLWDANYNAANLKLITPEFNLPWDAACCCCGGGTSKLEPGSKLRFKVPADYVSIAAKLTRPTLEGKLWEEYVNKKGYINTKAKKDWQEKLYPRFNASKKSKAIKVGLLHRLPTKTFTPQEASEYPYGPSGSACSDYELEKDVTGYSLQFKASPDDWADWAGYTCRFNYYQGSCKEDGTQDPADKAAFGPMEHYFNGKLKEEIVHAWTFEGNPPNVSLAGMQRADAFKICCACGGGRRKSGQGPKTVIDMLADSYYFK